MPGEEITSKKEGGSLVKKDAAETDIQMLQHELQKGEIPILGIVSKLFLISLC